MPKYLDKVTSKYWASKLAKNTMWMSATGSMVLGMQAVYFVLIARALGPNDYGAFAAAVSLVSVVGPFASWGMGNLLIRNVSRNHSLFEECWGNALLVTLVLGTLFASGIILSTRVIFHSRIPVSILFFVAISDLIFFRTLTVATYCFQAFEQMNWTGVLNVQTFALRLAAAVYLVRFIAKPTAADWALFYLLSTAVACAVSCAAVFLRLGGVRLNWQRLKTEFPRGVYFSLGNSSGSLHNDLDKVLLARLSDLQVTGLYAAAYRIVDAVSQPIAALSFAAYGRFFVHGENGMAGSRRFATKLLPASALYGVLVWISLLMGAPFVHYVLGTRYLMVGNILWWLAPIPLLRSFHYLAGNAMTGAELQSLRTALQFMVVAVNLGLNWIFIPLYSWRAAAGASLVCDSLLLLITWGAVFAIERRQQLRVLAVAHGR